MKEEEIVDSLNNEKKRAKETKVLLLNVLAENQHYHQLMHESYPENYS
jgi:hypothetical protein